MSKKKPKTAKYPQHFELYSTERPGLVETLLALESAWHDATTSYHDIEVRLHRDGGALANSPNYRFAVVLKLPSLHSDDAFRYEAIEYEPDPKQIVNEDTGDVFWVLEAHHAYEAREYGDELARVRVGQVQHTPLRAVHLPGKGVLWAADKETIAQLIGLAEQLKHVDNILAEREAEE